MLRISLFIFFLISFQLSASAAINPIFDFDRELGEQLSGDSSTTEQSVFGGAFQRFFGENLGVVISGHNALSPKKKIVNINKNQKTLLLSLDNGQDAKYLLEKDRVVAYTLIEHFRIFPAFKNDKDLVKIKSFSKDSTYLKGQLNQAGGLSYEFYIAPHLNHIEVYGILKTPSVDVLVLDAFYSKLAEKEFVPFIVQHLNHFIQMYSGN